MCLGPISQLEPSLSTLERFLARPHIPMPNPQCVGPHYPVLPAQAQACLCAAFSSMKPTGKFFSFSRHFVARARFSAESDFRFLLESAARPREDTLDLGLGHEHCVVFTHEEHVARELSTDRRVCPKREHLLWRIAPLSFVGVTYSSPDTCE